MKRLFCLIVLLLLASQGTRIAWADCSTPSFRALIPFATGAAPKTIIIGDFNLDGKPDLATATCLRLRISTATARPTLQSFVRLRAHGMSGKARIILFIRSDSAHLEMCPPPETMTETADRTSLCFVSQTAPGIS